MPDTFSHKPTLKQQNKPFKSKHASKGALRDKSKGKVQRTPVKGQVVKHSTKADRRNAAKLSQQKKREDLMRLNRMFEGRHGAPKIVAVLPLCPDVDAYTTVSRMFESASLPAPTKEHINPILTAPQFKQKLQFIPLHRNLVDVLDAFKVADFAILVMSSKVEVDDFGTLCLQAIQHQGIPNVLAACQHMSAVPAKKQPLIKKSLVSYTKQFFPGEHRITDLESHSDLLTAIRHMTSAKPSEISWRDQHSYMLADHVEFDGADVVGTLKVTGYARGTPFTANRLVHLQNLGDFQVSHIQTAPLPSNHSGMDEDAAVISRANEDRDDLISENEPDMMENEQTWPTEEELAEAEERVRGMTKDKPVTKRVPKGTSAYQAAWIVDDGSEDEYSDDEDGDMTVHDENEPAEDEEAEEYEDIVINGHDNQSMLDTTSEMEEQLDEVEEARQLKAHLERAKQAKDEMEFPDEVDTPLDIPARTRFARYRGLQSFRTSPWDPYENLPLDYARIFQFENYKKTKARVTTQALVGDVKGGTRITIFVGQVPRDIMNTYDPSRPFILFSLLQHEHKMSVLNITATRNSDHDYPIKSKDELIVQMGFRRLVVRPLFSQNTPGGKGGNNVHKFERFWPQVAASVVTFYGPIAFGNMPCLFFKATEDANMPHLVGTGTFSDADTKRIIAKRIILTGYPFKVHKRSAVIRYMFFNPEDVLYFKPIQLTSKYGRIGHIRESLGTHGYMKCLFDGPLTQQDTIMMNLYKRIFPKWNTTLWKAPAPIDYVGNAKDLEDVTME
ncbi:hypothetical protein BZG36_04488 [Bifiguratus adelaidae]|uniref:Bms1-type G domain-containing protein n=1 Tax=Bifiguratus adelaidae TaxID=1938954 RepID=A0A261XYE6_9FUNG|nr:hypothetical protein BZG36_04488 [Bifiguratus adelaidae]